MKLYFDDQIFNQRFGGISRYFTELIKGIKSSVDDEVYYNLSNTDNIHFRESGLCSRKFMDFMPEYHFSGKKRLIKYFQKREHVKQLQAIKEKRYDVFIPTYYNPYFLDLIGEKPFVLTVYDMIHELFPHYFSSEQSTIVLEKRQLIQKAKKIIAISENTKRDILRLYPQVDESRISVVYLSHSITDDVKNTSLNLPNRYILFVGNRNFYKNFIFFIESIASLLNDDKNLYVVCTGPKFNKMELLKFEKLGISSQLIYRNVADMQLKRLYQQALVFVFPSEYEGFGIPIIEAMASGCPVIVSNTSSFPEVAGDAALYFELQDKVGLANAVRKVVFNLDVQKKLRMRGYQQIKKFNWAKTVNGCYEVFKSAI